MVCFRKVKVLLFSTVFFFLLCSPIPVVKMCSKSAILSRPKSKVRKHFEDIKLQKDHTHVMCKEGIVKRKTFIKVGRVVGTHGMRNHLKSAHSKAWLDLLKEEEVEKQERTQAGQEGSTNHRRRLHQAGQDQSTGPTTVRL